MPFSHHSHSGQFCPGHARHSLEDMITTAISHRLRVFALTEHMPRHDIDHYPEEKETGINLDAHFANEAAYFAEACRLREKYKSTIDILVGFESDWIRPESRLLIDRSIRTHAFHFFVGSVHHVHTIPIDYDRPMYEQARRQSGGTDERLFEDYFDAQMDLLQAMKPPVVGHFDLVRLMSDLPDASFRGYAGVWTRILRNLDFVASYGGVLEVNTAALRKGMKEPYPKGEICQVATEKQIPFCLSDDSHGTDQVAYGCQTALEFLRECGVDHLSFLKHVEGAATHTDVRFANLQICQVKLADLDRTSP